MVVDLNSKPHSLTHIQNMSYDEDNQLAVREVVGVDPNGVVRKVPVGTDGSLQTSNNSLPTAGNNPSYSITKSTVGTVTTTTIVKTINSVAYTKTVVKDTSDGSETVSEWV